MFLFLEYNKKAPYQLQDTLSLKKTHKSNLQITEVLFLKKCILT